MDDPSASPQFFQRLTAPATAAGRCVAATVAVALVVSQTGCSFLASKRQIISVVSDPSGADVTINGQYAGTTPMDTSVPRGDENLIQVKKKGYRAINKRTSTSLSTVGIVDVIGGCIILLPFLGLLSDGAWKQDPANVGVTLQPEEEE